MTERPDGTPPPPAEAPRTTAAEYDVEQAAADAYTRRMGHDRPIEERRDRVRHLTRDDDYTPEAIDRDQDAETVPTTPSNDPPATDPYMPVPKAEPGPLTDVGPPHRTEPWSEHFAPVDVPRPGPVGPAATAPVDEADPEDGHPT